MIEFYQKNGEQYFQTRLEGTARYWAVGLIARDAMVNRPALATRSGQTAGPEVRLWQKLSDFSLDAWKDRVIDFEEKLDPDLFADKKELSLMLVRDDYLALYDEVSPGAPEGQFVWSSSFQMPQIYQLKPGVTAIETTTSEATPPPNAHDAQAPRTSRQRKYVGKGDFLTVVAPAVVQAQAQPFGATVNGEYVFASPKPEDVTQAAVVFSGNYGYARPNQLALFQGTKIGMGGLELRRDGGDFGLSAAMEKKRIVGRIVGRSGGKVFVVPPGGLNPAGASVTVNGKPVPHTVEQGAVAFLVDIAQKDGLKNYEIQFGK